MKATDWRPQSAMDQCSADDSDDVLHIKENQYFMDLFAGDSILSIWQSSRCHISCVDIPHHNMTVFLQSKGESHQHRNDTPASPNRLCKE
jgi:hypothetical protein